MLRHIHIYPCQRRGNSSGNHITSLNHSYTPLLWNSLIFLSILFFSLVKGGRAGSCLSRRRKKTGGWCSSGGCKAEQYGKEEKHPGISHARQRNFNFVPSLWNKFERDSFRCIYTLLWERERGLPHPPFSFPVILHAYEYGRNAANPENGVQELTEILLKRGQGRI